MQRAIDRFALAITLSVGSISSVATKELESRENPLAKCLSNFKMSNSYRAWYCAVEWQALLYVDYQDAEQLLS